jgi:hypothetical protein
MKIAPSDFLGEAISNSVYVSLPMKKENRRAESKDARQVHLTALVM